MTQPGESSGSSKRQAGQNPEKRPSRPNWPHQKGTDWQGYVEVEVGRAMACEKGERNTESKEAAMKSKEEAEKARTNFREA